jgi:hypothetical protein
MKKVTAAIAAFLFLASAGCLVRGRGRETWAEPDRREEARAHDRDRERKDHDKKEHEEKKEHDREDEHH